MSTSFGAADLAVGTGEARARVSWSAIFAGVVLAVALQLVLSLLGAGVGLGFVDPGHAESASASSLGVGAAVWWLASTVVALLAGSYAAARLAGAGSRFDGLLHGLVVWGLTLLLTFYLLTTAVGGVVGGAFSAVSGTLSAAGSAVSGAASAVGSGIRSVAPEAAQVAGLNPDTLSQQAQSLIASPTPSDPASMDPGEAAKAIAVALPRLFAGGPEHDAAKQRITAIVAAQAHISPQDAQARVDNAIARFQQDKQQAVQAAKNAADSSAAAASHASFLAVIGLLIGAAAASLGGVLASPRVTAVRRGF